HLCLGDVLHLVVGRRVRRRFWCRRFRPKEIDDLGGRRCIGALLVFVSPLQPIQRWSPPPFIAFFLLGLVRTQTIAGDPGANQFGKARGHGLASRPFFGIWDKQHLHVVMQIAGEGLVEAVVFRPCVKGFGLIPSIWISGFCFGNLRDRVLAAESNQWVANPLRPLLKSTKWSGTLFKFGLPAPSPDNEHSPQEPAPLALDVRKKVAGEAALFRVFAFGIELT